MGSPRSGVCDFPCGVSSRRSRSIRTGMISGASIRNLNRRIFARRSNLPRGIWTRACSLSSLCETPSARSGPAAIHRCFAEPGRVGRDSRLLSEKIGMSRADDTEILRRARADSRVCVTLDADFHSLLATSGERGPSVIRIRKEGLDATALAALLQTIWSRVEDALNSGALVTVTEHSIRVRRLPIVRL